MNKNFRYFAHWLQKKTGGFYPLIVFASAQFAWVVFAPISLYSIKTNADISADIFKTLTTNSGALFGILNLLALIWLASKTRTMRHALNRHKKNLAISKDEERLAWVETTWQARVYGWISLTLAVIQFVGIWLIARQLHVGSNNMLYILLAAIAGLVIAVQFGMALHEWALRPVYQVLAPSEISTALIGLHPRLRLRMTSVSLAMLLISIFLLAPIGYHQTYTVLYRAIGSLEVYEQLRTQLIIVSVLILFFGMVLTAIQTSLTVRPLQDLMDAFQKVQSGDLNYRINLRSTDEIGQVALHFNEMLKRIEALQNSLKKQVAEQTAQLRATNAVGQAVTSILDPDKLVARVVELISEQFDYYYAAIFIVDEEGKWAELRAASGEAGKVLLQRGHKLPVDGKNMVGAAIRLRSPRIALEAEEEGIRFDNPLLPYTRSEIALPLMVGDRVLGVLDVQSTKESAFKESDIEILQGMANQVAVALSNAVLFIETQQALQELKNAQRQYVLQAWEARMSNQTLEYQVGDEEQQDAKQSLRLPISLRDQILGEMIIEGKELSEEERAWAEALITQAAVALENARLLEESQQTALRERLIADISQKIWASRSIENILKTAVRELGQTLQASEASIELTPEEEQA